MRRTALGAAPVGRQPAPVYNGSRTPRKYFAPYGSHSTCTVEISQNCSSAQIRREHEGEDGAERDARKKTAPHPRAPVSAKEAERTLMQLTQTAAPCIADAMLQRAVVQSGPRAAEGGAWRRTGSCRR